MNSVNPNNSEPLKKRSECLKGTYQKAIDIGEGSHRVGFFNGWINIEKTKNGLIHVIWTSSKNSHSLMSSKRSVSITLENTTAFNVMKSALSFHPVRNQEERDAIVLDVCNMIDRAFLRKAASNKLYVRSA